MIVLFDGLCNLCDGSVRFLLQHDRARRLRFGAIQSEAGRVLLEARGIDPDRLDTFVVIDDDRALTRSDAVLAIAASLRFPWRLLSACRVIPRRLRDAIYRFVASNRYRWFGRRTECAVPDDEVRERFI